MDWRWGFNALTDQREPGWFSKHGTVFREGARLEAVSIAEEGRDATCIITRGPDVATVRSVVAWLMDHRLSDHMGLSFEIADRASWLSEVFRRFDLRFEANTGNEWEFDLSASAETAPLADGFTIETLRTNRAADYGGIADCIRAAFDTTHDVRPVLGSLEGNPMFRPELSVFARSPDGRIAAYCRGTVDPDNGVGGIDPVCCHPDFQRMGLSKAVVRACMRTQRDLGGRFTYIGSAPEPAPGTFLYRSLGPSDVSAGSTWYVGPRT
jgi:ribosomal protein S18 acetylase RimI-like enzyme